MRPTLAVLCLMPLLAACKVGYDPGRHPTARAPRGTTVTVSLRSRNGGSQITLVSGELVAVMESGLIVERVLNRQAADGSLLAWHALVRIPYDLRATYRFEGASGNRSIRGPSGRTAFETAIPVARHPYGLTPEQLTELLRLSGQDTLLVFSLPRGPDR